MPLTDEQVDRYSRQIILPEVGGLGQEKLLAACVWVSGSGAVAAWASRYLAAAGVGAVAIEPSLAGAIGVEIAALNPDCRVETKRGSGRAPSAILACAWDRSIAEAWRDGVPVVAARQRGVAADLTVLSSSHPASACPDCCELEPLADGGGEEALPSAAPLVAVLAVSEVLKLVLGVGRPLHGRRLKCDARTQAVGEAPLAGRPGCAQCGRQPAAR